MHQRRRLDVAALAALVAAGCGPGIIGPPLAPKETLQIRTMMDYTGPTSDNAAVYYQGIKDAWREANATGGIRGYKLEEKFYDHAYVLDRAQAQYDAWKAEPSWPAVVTFFSWGTPDTQMFSADAAKEGKPFISGSYANTLATPVAQEHLITLPEGPREFKAEPAPYNFFAGTDYGTQARIGMEFAKKKGGHKVGYAYCSRSPFCAEPIAAGKTWAARIGLEQGPDVNPELEDATAAIDVKMKAYIEANRDVDWFWVGNSITTTLWTAKAVKKYNPAAKLIVNMWGMDERAWEMCGADCVGNVFVVMSFAAFGDLRYPAMDEVVALHKKSRQLDGDSPVRYANVRYVQGFVSFFVFRRAVEQLVDLGRPVTGPNLKQALETFRGLESGGLTAPITFTPDDHRPTNRVRVYSMNQFGKFQFEDEIAVQLERDWMGW